jgi:polyisoprenoid-binding protein YceI
MTTFPTSPANLQAPPTGRYVIDTATSTLTFATRHMFGLGRVSGRFSVLDGSVVVAERLEDSAARAEISAASFSTRNPIRDGQVRSRLFLHASRHPRISFRSDGVARRDDGWAVTGTVTVKDKSAPIELVVTGVAVEGLSVVFTARGTLDRYAHGVKAFPGMAARHLSVEISAHTRRG